MQTLENKAKELYYRDLGNRASEAMLGLVRRGEFPGCPPVGYRNSLLSSGPRIVADERLAPLVREAFRLASDPKLSLRRILAVMTERGLRSRNGKPLGPSALSHLLSNPFYTGRIRYLGGLVPGNHLALVDDELFATVLDARQDRGKRKGQFS